MSIRMGFAETDITADEPVSLIGFYREEADRLVRAATENIKREEKKSEIQ